MKLFGFLLMLVICASCKNTNVNKDLHQLDFCMVSEEDVESYLPPDDSIIALNDIAKCDSLIRLEKDKNNLFMLYQQKVNLLAGIGKVKDAYHNQGIAMELLSENDARRLEYEAIGAYLQHDMERYSQLLHKAIDEYQKESDDATYALSQATCYTLLGEDRLAKSVLKNFLKHNDDQTISIAYEDFSLFKKQVIEGRSKLMELLKAGDR